MVHFNAWYHTRYKEVEVARVGHDAVSYLGAWSKKLFISQKSTAPSVICMDDLNRIDLG